MPFLSSKSRRQTTPTIVYNRCVFVANQQCREVQEVQGEEHAEMPMLMRTESAGAAVTEAIAAAAAI